MQKRLVRKLDLEVFLSKVDPHPFPKASLEQYTIAPAAAAELLYIAAYSFDDIIDKTVVDLGCGSGRLAIGAALLGAKEVVGVDIDKAATKRALENAKKIGIEEKTQWITADIALLRGNFDTVLQNPPFGVQKRKADRKFLEKALEIGKRVYSLHKNSGRTCRNTKRAGRVATSVSSTSSLAFLKKLIEKNGGQIKTVYPIEMMIPYLFRFHRRQKRRILVDLYIIDRERIDDLPLSHPHFSS